MCWSDLAAKSYCIMCGTEKHGLAVRDDWELGLIRWFKRNVSKNEKGNRLVVCRTCYPKYAANRSKYESRQKLYITLGVIFAALSLLISPSIASVLVAALVIVLMFAFSLLSYTPKISIKNEHEK